MQYYYEIINKRSLNNKQDLQYLFREIIHEIFLYLKKRYNV